MLDDTRRGSFHIEMKCISPGSQTDSHWTCRSLPMAPSHSDAPQTKQHTRHLKLTAGNSRLLTIFS